MAMYVVPCLQPESDSAASCNSLLNTGAWDGDNEWFHTYTLLLPEDIPRYLGSRVIHSKAVMEVLTMGPLPFPRRLSDLASREELITWLTRVLLNILSPGVSVRQPLKIVLPNNLVAYFALLLHLHRVGFPAHWLSDFLRSLLSGDLVTDIDSYRGKYPIPVSEITRRVPRRRIRLDPWLLEFETVLAIAHKGIPFPVALPQDYAQNASDIGTYEALVMPARMAPPMDFDDIDMSPFSPMTRLLLYKPGNGGPDPIVDKLPRIMEGKTGPPPGEVYVVTSPDTVDYLERVTWKMSKRRVEQMRKEKWQMVAYRIGMNETGESSSNYG